MNARFGNCISICTCNKAKSGISSSREVYLCFSEFFTSWVQDAKVDRSLFSVSTHVDSQVILIFGKNIVYTPASYFMDS